VSIFTKSNKKSSSRKQIDIKGVRDGLLLLPKGAYRAVLSISSVNFELKSETEQDALIDTYQSFLNSLAISFQIVVRIREMDMDKYIDDFMERQTMEEEQVYKDLVSNYTDFVRSLVTKNKILSRQFYIVLPLDTKEKDFDVIKEQMNLSIDIVSKGLARLGMQSRRLDSIEILDLFYGFYAPLQSKSQPLKKQTLQLLTEGYL